MDETLIEDDILVLCIIPLDPLEKVEAGFIHMQDDIEESESEELDNPNFVC